MVPTQHSPLPECLDGWHESSLGGSPIYFRFEGRTERLGELHLVFYVSAEPAYGDGELWDFIESNMPYWFCLRCGGFVGRMVNE